VENKITLKFEPYFISSEEDLDEHLNWIQRDAVIKGADGSIIFQQKDVEFPDFWSDTAVNIVSDKYFRGILGSDEREYSLKQLVNRVVDTITQYGIELGYFDDENAKIFQCDLKFLIYMQYYSFNSPVYFNVGIDPNPQVAACFILGVDDHMPSIMELARTEAMIFKGGSGAGTNFSKLRSKYEHLSGGGKASGPVSFMRGLDSFSGVIKSGGKTRRAAKMAILDIDHLDILEFVECKLIEEGKASALIQAGYSPHFEADNNAYSSVAFQNENHTIRVFDKFMQAVEQDDEWDLRYVTNQQRKYVKAREIFMRICECAHQCGDPGLLFSDTANRYHTTPASGKIVATNPCGEYIDIDDSACNLGSFNLMRFVQHHDSHFSFDVDAFKAAVRIATIAQEIIIDKASYPTDKIKRNAVNHRQLGLGYSNLGTLIMYCGYPYDSRDGRALAASISALLTSSVYNTSCDVALVKGTFKEFDKNKDKMQQVLWRHASNVKDIETDVDGIKEIIDAVEDTWQSVTEKYQHHGIRNSKATVIAPTGTIGFMMDCDTTGAEPELFLVKHKTLVGGGSIKIVNRSIGHVLANLGYDQKTISKIANYITENETLERCKLIKKEHIPIFDCAFGSSEKSRVIAPEGHVRMLAAIQPHISGGISKTVNLPEKASVQDVYNIFMLAHKLKLKAITIYRNNSKGSQPLNVKKNDDDKKPKQVKRKMAAERKALAHDFNIQGHKIYLHCGLFPDGTLGEIFIRASKEGSTMTGLLDSIAVLTSTSLQYGVPLEVLSKKLAYTTFEPQGFTPKMGYARSITDYIFRYLLQKFSGHVLDGDTVIEDDEEAPVPPRALLDTPTYDAPPCPNCGSIMVRNGSCFKCETCGETSGCS